MVSISSDSSETPAITITPDSQSTYRFIDQDLPEENGWFPTTRTLWDGRKCVFNHNITIIPPRDPEADEDIEAHIFTLAILNDGTGSHPETRARRKRCTIARTVDRRIVPPSMDETGPLVSSPGGWHLTTLGLAGKTACWIRRYDWDVGEEHDVLCFTQIPGMAEMEDELPPESESISQFASSVYGTQSSHSSVPVLDSGSASEDDQAVTASEGEEQEGDITITAMFQLQLDDQVPLSSSSPSPSPSVLESESEYHSAEGSNYLSLPPSPVPSPPQRPIFLHPCPEATAATNSDSLSPIAGDSPFIDSISSEPQYLLVTQPPSPPRTGYPSYGPPIVEIPLPAVVKTHGRIWALQVDDIWGRVFLAMESGSVIILEFA